MIPVALIGGVAVGRVYAIPLLGIFWALVLALHGGCDGGCELDGAGLALANAPIGVIVRKVITLSFGRRRTTVSGEPAAKLFTG